MRRRLLIVAIFLLLGAVVNVAVAWGCALTVDLGKGRELTLHVEETMFSARLRRHPGAIRALVWRSNDADVPADELVNRKIQNWHAYFWSAFHLWAAGQPRNAPPQLQPNTQHSDDGDNSVFPRWISSSDLAKRELWGGDLPTPIVHDARGWPFLAMRCQVVFPIGGAQGQQHITGGIWMRPRAGGISEWLSYRVLPIRPTWPGFAINTLFYAAVVWSLIFGRFALRRHLRRKRGLCVSCGYDLSGNLSQGCTECGWRREAEG